MIHLHLPDDAQKSFQEPRCISDFFYEPNVVVFRDGPPHNFLHQRRVNVATRNALLERSVLGCRNNSVALYAYGISVRSCRLPAPSNKPWCPLRNWA